MGIITSKAYKKAAGSVRKFNHRQHMDIEKFGEGVLRHALTDRDWAHIKLRTLDIEAQLLAIKSLIRRNQEADEDLERKIEALYEQARRTTDVRNSPYQDDQWVDETHQSFFQDAAHSMAAVGMLAPFIESLFTAIFPCLPEERKNNHEGVAKVISRLAESNGLSQFFPDDYNKVLDALYLYRNKMFHNGFIWSENERRKFQEKIKNPGWPKSWFVETNYRDSREKTEEPRIFCMSTEFIEHCLWTIEQVLDGYGQSAREASEK